MNGETATKIFNRIGLLEKELQRLKIESYFCLPKVKQKGFYSEDLLKKTVRAVREKIWQEKYAKKV